MADVVELSMGQPVVGSRAAQRPVVWLRYCPLRLRSTSVLPNASVLHLPPARWPQARPVGSAAAAPAQPASVWLPQAAGPLIVGGPPQARMLGKASGLAAPQRLLRAPAA